MDALRALSRALRAARAGARRTRFWRSLFYFNVYRVAMATLAFTISMVYGDALSLGAHAQAVFRYTALGYLAARHRAACRGAQPPRGLQRAALAADGARHRGDHAAHVRERRHPQRPGRHAADLDHRRCDRRAAAPRALSTPRSPRIALLLEQSYGVLAHDAPETRFLQPGLLAIGCFAMAGVTQLARAARGGERGARARSAAAASRSRRG